MQEHPKHFYWIILSAYFDCRTEGSEINHLNKGWEATLYLEIDVKRKFCLHDRDIFQSVSCLPFIYASRQGMFGFTGFSIFQLKIHFPLIRFKFDFDGGTFFECTEMSLNFSCTRKTLSLPQNCVIWFHRKTERNSKAPPSPWRNLQIVFTVYICSGYYFSSPKKAYSRQKSIS